MMAALSDGPSRITGCLMSEDVRSTINAFRILGVEIYESGDNEIVVEGVGVDGLLQPKQSIDLGNSGTSMRLLCGILAGAGLSARLTGDQSLCSRPMKRIVDPLQLMGAEISGHFGTKPPLSIGLTKGLVGITYEMPVASAQVKSALILAGLYAKGVTSVIERGISRDHTELMLPKYGVFIDTSTPNLLRIEGGQRLTANDLSVPKDFSSAAFFLVAALISSNSEIIIPEVGINPTRVGLLEVLKSMGGDIQQVNEREIGGELVADLVVRSSKLLGVKVKSEIVPRMIDEFPILFVAAACAEGETIVRGAEELRFKESDRITTMRKGLVSLGINVEELPDGLKITGGDISGGKILVAGDHRVAMSFAVLAVRSQKPIEILGPTGISTSFPTFQTVARSIGLRIGT
jgi:3-phosphoshikimate 1-carboxyvinyltransferase